MLAGRIVAALCHGAFFGIGAVVAAGLVAPAKRAGAIAMMFAGLTTANVLGVPFGTLLGQQLRLARHLLGDHRRRRGRAGGTGPAGARTRAGDRRRRPPAACAASCAPSAPARSGSRW